MMHAALPQGHSAFARPMAGVLRTLRPLRTCCSRWSRAASLYLPAPAIAPHCRVTFRNLTIPSASAAHPPAAAHRMPMVRDTIEPTELEQRIFKTLKAAAADGGTPVTLRCAGGWVRDKLLGVETDSPDIDVALDTLTGAAFGQALQRHLQESHDEVARAVVIESNPEQSKHLETARIRVHGVSLDLVNLRSETYTQDSRIPGAIQFGTPEQDALRRDLTINALFYNLDTCAVEDFSGRGLDDLRAGVVRTPLAPRETFMDDPLRVLRAVRFAARFGFELDAALVEAAALPEVQVICSFLYSSL